MQYDSHRQTPFQQPNTYPNLHAFLNEFGFNSTTATPTNLNPINPVVPIKSLRQQQIISNLIGQLFKFLQKSHLQLLSGITIEVENDTFYPDLVLIKTPTKETDSVVVKHPIIIIDIVSDYNRNDNRLYKLKQYQKLETLKEYVLVEKDEQRVTIYRAIENWYGEVYLKDDTITLSSINYKINIGALYNNITMPVIKEYYHRASQKKAFNFRLFFTVIGVILGLLILVLFIF